jgi:hypothetical protein
MNDYGNGRLWIAALASLMLWAVSVQPGLAAEKAGAPATAEDSGGGDATAQAESKPGATQPETPSPEIFVPTEKVSEDFAVSFPVDI